MSEVEDKYKKDIKNAGGYEKFIKTLLNRDVKADYENNLKINPIFSVEIELKDILIPSIPCKSVVIKRSYDLKNDQEDLKITGLLDVVFTGTNIDNFIGNAKLLNANITNK